MGEIGIDEWCRRMKEHQRKGHQIIKYPEMDVKSVNDIEQDLFIKEQRANLWEKHQIIPTTNNLIWWEREVET